MPGPGTMVSCFEGFPQDYDQDKDQASHFFQELCLQNNGAFPATALDLPAFGSEANIFEHLSPF